MHRNDKYRRPFRQIDMCHAYMQLLLPHVAKPLVGGKSDCSN